MLNNNCGEKFYSVRNLVKIFCRLLYHLKALYSNVKNSSKILGNCYYVNLHKTYTVNPSVVGTEAVYHEVTICLLRSKKWIEIEFCH